MSVQIRILESSDAAACQALRLRALHECPAEFSSSYEEEHDTSLARVAERLAPGPDRAVFGAFDSGTLVGTVGLRRLSRRKLAHKAVFWGVYVAPEYRRRGIARRLMERALAHAASMPGLLTATLGANAANAASVALYKALGFEPFGVERGFALVDGMLCDEIHMARPVVRPRADAEITHSGGCHCGRVRFEVVSPARLVVMDCNCSICGKSGYLHLIVPKSRFKLKSGAEALTTYGFNTGTAKHLFCSVCGVKSFYVPRSHPDGYSVNARCLDEGTVEQLIVVPSDGKNWEKTHRARTGDRDR